MNLLLPAQTQAEAKPSITPALSALLQRKCACGGSAGLDGECDDCRSKRLQRHAANGVEPTTVPPIVHEVLHSPGEPLDPNVRGCMEQRFGHDFSNVRVHVDGKAEKSAQAVNARAYTVGKDIVFGTGEYRPGTTTGQQLLAHELTHTLQQRNDAKNAINLRVGLRDDFFERQASTQSYNVASTVSRSRLNQPAAQLQRTPLPELREMEGITTPQPVEAQRTRGGSTNFQMQSVTVVFLPDRRSRSQSMANRAETRFNINAYQINFRTLDGRVASFTGPGPVRVTIQTTYGPRVNRTSTSGYGRGTTPEDVAAGQTTLGFHEAQHGIDFMQFLQDNPFPQFTGAVGMSPEDFRAAMDEYRDARAQYQQNMDAFSSQRTDCVGTTIDQSNAAGGLATTICQQQAAPAD